jgi:hypothetical protein
VLTQSLAMIEYLEEIHPTPPLLPSTPLDRAFVRSIALSIACDTHPINNLRVTFDIERNSFSTPNKGKVQIYNMSDLRRSLYYKGLQLALSVGYGSIPIPLYRGWVQDVRDERHSGDIITNIELGENAKEIVNSIVNFAFPAGTTDLVVATSIITAMGLIPGPIAPSWLAAPKPYNSGVAFSSNAKIILDNLVSSRNLNWYVQNQIVTIAEKGQPSSPLIIPVDITTGLLGVPNLSMGQGKDNVLTFEHLLVPYLTPGVVVALESKFIVVTALVKKTVYDGDTHGSKWSVKCECTPISLG